MGTTSLVVLAVATVAAGLLAGLFYAYACSVLPGLARGDDQTFVEGMRGINIAIVNGWFLVTFLGAPLLAAAAGILHLGSGVPLWWIVAGFACLVATLVITGVVNIPLNNALDSGRTSYAELRATFEASWVRWNVVRTVASVAGFGCLIGALASRV
ncbi:MAG TPA: anthrone oxygenase family protein [Pseudonocardiaceae bacterium]|nr:anthrone oxygenase family protein [Pseudonocardiaceae bacterium]